MSNSVLAQEIIRTAPIANRFTDLLWANDPTAAGGRKGWFSMVFRALDLSNGRLVALKFLDVTSPYFNQYRHAAFAREADLLAELETCRRCLRLVCGVTIHTIFPSAGTGQAIPISCQFFAVEWLQDDIEHYFHEQERFETVAKLHIIREVTLAISALHMRGVFHRDIKADNFRLRDASVVALDLGTAARVETQPMSTPMYDSGPVGHLAYASPEAHCGLAADRSIAPRTDVFAIGCLLYELFHFAQFWQVWYQNQTVGLIFGHLRNAALAHAAIEQRRATYEQSLDKLSRAIPAPAFDPTGCTAPPAIHNMLDRLLSSLVAFDYRKREINLAVVCGRIDIMIKVLTNEEWQRKLLEQKRQRRHNQQQKLAQRLLRSREADLLGTEI